jgi:serine-type D-Ala-D-Ala carboxypeptidase/endopeptidase (penicillin-binding protein 4)
MRENLQNKWAAKTIVFLLHILIAVVAVAQVPKKAVASIEKSIGPDGSMGGLAVNLVTGDTLFSISPQLRLVPASVMKLYTTGAALELLGADFKYNTKVLASGHIDNGVINGDLVVVGGADPTLGSKVLPLVSSPSCFDNIFSLLQKAGIRSVSGNIVVDASYFEQLLPPPGRLWEDIGNYYGAVPSGVNYSDNSFDLFLRSPAIPNAPCSIVETIPQLPNIRFQCKVKSSLKSIDSAYVYGLNGMSDWTVEGAMPMGQSRFRIRGALPNPPLLFATDLYRFLNAKGIAVKGNPTTGVFSKSLPFVELGVLQSVALSEIVSYINVFSNNLLADNLYLTIGKEIGGFGNWDTSQRIVSRFWTQKTTHGYAVGIGDGSGLAPANKLSAIALIDMLGYMHRSPSAASFKQSLAVGGKTGTLRSMWTAPAYRGKVFAKSGTLNGVVAYSGYFVNANGQMCAFAVIVNNSLKPSSEIRKAIEGFVADYL